MAQMETWAVLVEAGVGREVSERKRLDGERLEFPVTDRMAVAVAVGNSPDGRFGVVTDARFVESGDVVYWPAVPWPSAGPSISPFGWRGEAG